MADTTQIEAFFASYAKALTEAFTGNSGDAAAGHYEFPALVIQDEASWAYSEAAPLAHAFDVLRGQFERAGGADISIEVTHVEPLTGVLNSVDVEWDFNGADGEAVLRQGWRYVVRTTPDGPRIRTAAIYNRTEA